MPQSRPPYPPGGGLNLAARFEDCRPAGLDTQIRNCETQEPIFRPRRKQPPRWGVHTEERTLPTAFRSDYSGKASAVST